METGAETDSHVKEGGQRDSVLRAGQEDLRGVTRFNLKNLFLICVIHFSSHDFSSAILTASNSPPLKGGTVVTIL